MTWIKFCGMTRRSDVEAAGMVGADAVGFVVAPGTPRCITPGAAAALGAGVSMDRYLVTVDLQPDEVIAAASEAGVDGVQPHGRYAPEAAAAALAAGYRVLFPIRVAGSVDLEGVPPGAVPLLDAAVGGSHGGTGRRFDWSLAAGLGHRIVLAGGLTPDTVGEAVAVAAPWGVDVSSGLETAPGEKDEQLMRRFVEAVR